MRKFKIRLTSPTWSRWITVTAISESVARSMAVGNAKNRWVAEVVEA